MAHQNAQHDPPDKIDKALPPWAATAQETCRLKARARGLTTDGAKRPGESQHVGKPIDGPR
eukprot:9464256-Lingulodinium_polyedra.AAC.1